MFNKQIKTKIIVKPIRRIITRLMISRYSMDKAKYDRHKLSLINFLMRRLNQENITINRKPRANKETLLMNLTDIERNSIQHHR